MRIIFEENKIIIKSTGDQDDELLRLINEKNKLECKIEWLWKPSKKEGMVVINYE